MALSLTQTSLVRIVAGQAITNNLLRLLALSPSVSISGSVTTSDITDGAVTPAKATPGAYFYAADASNTNTYAATYTPAVGSYANGLQLLLKVTNANTAAAVPSLNANSLGAKNIYHRNGQTPKAGDIPANSILHLVYNSSHNAAAGGFEITGITPSATIRPAVNDTAGSATVQTVVNAPVMTAYQVGQLFLVKVGSGLTNTGALTLNCDGVGARNVLMPGGAALPIGIWQAGRTHLLYDDGTQFILLTREAVTAVVANCRNLVIQSTSTTQATVAADEVVLKHTGTGQPLLVQAPSFTMDVTLGVALNGFETGGARTTSRWFYLWMISDGTNVRGVLEDSGTADGAVPGGPDLSGGTFAGYAYYALVGQIRLNATGSGEIVGFFQHDRRVWTIEQAVLVNSDKAAADTWQILDNTATADLTAFRAAVPPTARTCSGFSGAADADHETRWQLSAAASDGSLTTTSLIGLKMFSIFEPSGSTEWNSYGCVAAFDQLPVRGSAARNIQWKRLLDSTHFSLSISGYTF